MEDIIQFWVNRINLAKDSDELFEEFQRCQGLVHEPEIHNPLFERIYLLRNASWDLEEIKHLDALRDQVETEVSRFFCHQEEKTGLLTLLKDVHKWFRVPDREPGSPLQ
jgi:hypothetical protein